MNLKRLPRIGMLFIGAERFCPLGEGTPGGTYPQRKADEIARYTAAFAGKAEVIPSGIVCTRQEAEDWAGTFLEKDVDCVIAFFLSWAEDAQWIAFLRQLHPVPLMLASVVRDRLVITDTQDEDQLRRSAFFRNLWILNVILFSDTSSRGRTSHRPATAFVLCFVFL